MVTAQEIITNLTEGVNIPKATIAGKMRVSERTIIRWSEGLTTPNYAELKMLNQIYRGHKVAKKGK